jgi:chorismate mutase
VNEPDAARLAGIRGAITVVENTASAIVRATERVLLGIAEANCLGSEDVVSVLLTATRDLDAAFPAAAVRAVGWDDVPVLCAQEIPVSEALPRVIRALVHAYLPRDREGLVRHVYLEGAVSLRPDLAPGGRGNG